MDRVAITLAEQGNTSSASIPLALDKAVRDGRDQTWPAFDDGRLWWWTRLGFCIS